MERERSSNGGRGMIYIYIYREREREREGGRFHKFSSPSSSVAPLLLPQPGAEEANKKEGGGGGEGREEGGGGRGSESVLKSQRWEVVKRDSRWTQMNLLNLHWLDENSPTPHQCLATASWCDVLMYFRGNKNKTPYKDFSVY